MKNVLLIGFSNAYGGIENFICALLDKVDPDKVRFSLLIYAQITEEEKRRLEPYHIPVYRMTQFGKNPFLFLRQIYRFYKEHDEIDVIHINASHGMTMLYTLPVWFDGRKKIICHSHNMRGNLPWLHKCCRIVINMRSDRKLACSGPAARYMFGTERGVTIVKNGIELEKYRFDRQKREKAREVLGFSNETFVIGNVGRFVPEKNQLFLLDIFCEVRKQRPDSRLVLVGNGPMVAEVSGRIKELKIEDSVLFAGQSEQTQTWYQIFDAFVLPSSFEGFPFVGVEAQAAGLPVFVSDAVSPELRLTDSFFFESLSQGAEVWADHILQKSDGIERNRECLSGLRSQGYSVEETAAFMEALYCEI